jgi:hypothetical protein
MCPYATRCDRDPAAVSTPPQRRSALPAGMTFDAAKVNYPARRHPAVFSFSASASPPPRTIRCSRRPRWPSPPRAALRAQRGGHRRRPRQRHATGSGFYLATRPRRLLATPAAGLRLELGRERESREPFRQLHVHQRMVNRSLVVNFVPMATLSFSQPHPGALALFWPDRHQPGPATERRSQHDELGGR